MSNSLIAGRLHEAKPLDIRLGALPRPKAFAPRYSAKSFFPFRNGVRLLGTRLSCFEPATGDVSSTEHPRSGSLERAAPPNVRRRVALSWAVSNHGKKYRRRRLSHRHGCPPNHRRHPLLVEHDTYPLDEIAIRFSHRLVAIRPSRTETDSSPALRATCWPVSLGSRLSVGAAPIWSTRGRSARAMSRHSGPPTSMTSYAGRLRTLLGCGCDVSLGSRRIRAAPAAVPLRIDCSASPRAWTAARHAGISEPGIAVPPLQAQNESRL